MSAELFLSIITGAAAGYITNKIAVNMLFKKYLKRFGGVILDHYDEFIENFSTLIEEDLVNSTSLKKEISCAPFNNELKNLVEDIIKNELPKKTYLFSFAEIPCIEECFKNLNDATIHIQKQFLKCVYDVVQNKKIKTIISKEQYDHIVKKSVPRLDIKGLFETQEDKINNFLCSYAPLFIDVVIDLIKKNKTELNGIINAAIDREFKNEGISFKIILFLKNIYQINIVDLIIKKLQKDKDEIAKKIPQKIIENIKTHLTEDAISKKLLSKRDTVLDKEISSVVTTLSAINFKMKSIDLNLIWDKTKHKKINSLYSAIQNEDIYKKCSCVILKFINNNIDTLLKNNVSLLASKQLSKSTAQEVNNMVRDFMGSELKPINFIGLALGALIGGASVVIVNALNLMSLPIYYMAALNAVVFAGVGIATNALAIRMLFRPYKAICRLNFPPFLGIVAARKSDFAKNISVFVQEKMLSGETVYENFFIKKDKIKEEIKIKLEKNNYQIIDDFLSKGDHLDTLSFFLYKAAKKHTAANTSFITNTLCDFIKELLKNSNVDSTFIARCLAYIDSSLIKSLIKNNVLHFMYEFLGSRHFQASLILDIIGAQDHISNIADSLFNKEIPKFLQDKKDDIDGAIDYLTENIPLDALLKNIKDEIKDDLTLRINNILKSPETINYEILQRDMQIFLESFIQNDLPLIEDSMQKILNSFIRHINSSLTAETKDAIFIDYFLDASLNSCIKQTTDLLSSLDLQHLIENEINDMSASEIEKLFYKFAGEYFKKIIFYGWIGLFAGVLGYGISCLLRLF